MKTHFFTKTLIIYSFLFLALSCQKDEEYIAEIRPSKQETPAALPGQDLPFGKTEKELKDMGIFLPKYSPDGIVLYTGTNVTVFFDRHGVFASTNALDSVQTVVNLRHVDSITYETYWTSPSITIGGVECWIYNIRFYESGNLVLERTTFAKFRGIQHRQIIGPLEGFDSPILFFHSVRLSNTFSDFDRQCLKNKLIFQYIIRDRHTDGSSHISDPFLRSISCVRDEIIYQRLFKP